MTRSVEDMSSFGSTVRHACAVAVSDEHLWELSASFISAGIAAGEQVSYFDDGTTQHVLERLLDDGADLDRMVGSGQLVVVSEEATRAALLSSLDQIAGIVEQTVDRALGNGFPGVRMTGQLNHSLHRANGVTLQEYDEALEKALVGRPAKALCLYDRARYPDEIGRAHV